MAKFGEGDAVKDLLWFIGILALMGVAWFVMGGPARYEASQKGEYVPPPSIAPTSTGDMEEFPASERPANEAPEADPAASQGDAKTPDNSLASNESPYKGQVRIQLGQTYRSAGTTDREYVVLRADYSNPSPINITGWKISNGRGEKYYSVYDKEVRGTSILVAIPAGTELLTGTAKSRLVPIKLNPGDTAYVVTGRMPVSSPYAIDASFRVNKCSGYLEEYDSYDFTPSLYARCPSYDEEMSPASLSDECYRWVSDYGANCRTPRVSRDSELGEVVDGSAMAGNCKRIILSTFSYPSCIARHASDKDFYHPEWRIFLRYPGIGLYEDDRATLTLYDAQGKIVDDYSY